MIRSTTALSVSVCVTLLAGSAGATFSLSENFDGKTADTSALALESNNDLNALPSGVEFDVSSDRLNIRVNSNDVGSATDGLFAPANGRGAEGRPVA